MTAHRDPSSALLDRIDIARLPALRVPARRTVVVVPHPDDESLSTGGLIARQRQSGIDVVVVAVTDGEAAYEHWNGEALAQVRRGEQAAALHSLGVVGETVRLGLPDSAVSDHVDALVAALDQLLRPDDLLVAPCLDDWHPDHVACARAAEQVTARHRGVVWWGSAFWMHHFPPARLPDGLSVLALDDHEVTCRMQAVACHASQLTPEQATPIVGEQRRAHLRAGIELYVVTADLQAS